MPTQPTLDRLPMELRIVLQAIRRALSIQPGDTPALPAADVSWGRVLECAEAHRVLPLVYRGLKADDGVAFPKAAIPDFRLAAMKMTARSLMLAEELGRLARLFDGRGVRYFTVKGPALAAQLYREPAVRTMRDLDFILHPDDFAAARAVLDQEGFRPRDPVIFANSAHLARYVAHTVELEYQHSLRNYIVEIHTRPTHIYGLFPYSFEELWSEVEWVALAGVRVPTLPLPRHFRYVAMHGSRHGWYRLSWLVDIAAFLMQDAANASESPPSEARRATLRLDRVMGSTLSLSHLCFGTPLQPTLRQASDRDQATRKIVAYSLRSPAKSGPPNSLPEKWRLFGNELRLLPGPLHKVQVAQLYLTVNQADILCFPLPKRLGFLYPWLHPLFWAIRKLAPRTAARYRALAAAASEETSPPPLPLPR